jgi:cytochrome c5
MLLTALSARSSIRKLHMSSQKHHPEDRVGQFAGLILALTFIAIFFLVANISSGLSFSPTVPEPERAQAVAQAEPTATEPPTSTPPPPTATPTTAPSATPTPPPTSTPEPEPAAAADDPGAAYDPAIIARGEQLYVQCGACHGMDAQGVPNLGKDLTSTDFMRSHTDDELLQFIITGRPIWDPDNTTGIDMPSRGGNPALTNDDILAIIAYLRSLDDGQ